MPIIKEDISKNGKIHVTFILDAESVKSAQYASVVGNFNHWDPLKHPMEKLEDGSFKKSIDIPKGGEYQFRYLIDGDFWLNEPDADDTVSTEYGDAQNSLLRL